MNPGVAGKSCGAHGIDSPVMRVNKRAGKCDVCAQPVGEMQGFLLGPHGGWSTVCADHKPQPPERRFHETWKNPGLASFDLETTGIAPAHDRIVSAGFIDEFGQETELLMNPGIPIPAVASNVHGITDADVVDAISAAEGVAVVRSWIARAIENLIPVVVYNAPYDLTMLRAEIDRYGLEQLEWNRLLVIDPLVIDWGIQRGRLGPRKLDHVCDYYKVSLTDAHTALADARAAREVAFEMAARHEILQSKSFDDLMLDQVRWFADRTEDWNKWAKTQANRRVADPDGWPLAHP